MEGSLCCLLIYVNHALDANINVASMSLNAIHTNKILKIISEFTVPVGPHLGETGLMYVNNKGKD